MGRTTNVREDGPGRPATRPKSTREEGTRLSLRASAEWLWWLRGFARSLGVSVSVLVVKAIEEFAYSRGHKIAPPRYEYQKRFNPATGEWVDQLPWGHGQVGVPKPQQTPTNPDAGDPPP